MLSPLVCGSFSSQEDEDDIDVLLGQCSTPKRSRKTNRDSRNPYANRGLDKFAALVAELEDKKQKIFTQKGSEDISFVRFVYSGSNDWKPIVVKSKDRKQGSGSNNVGNVKAKRMSRMNSLESEDKHTIEASTVVQEVRQQQKEESSQGPVKKSTGWSLKLENLRHPCWYMPVMMFLILLFLVLCGRSFAILCTSLGWYLVPVIKQRSSTSEETKKTKKDYVRRLSEKNMVNDKVASPKGSRPSSPRSVLSRPAETPTGLHAHRKSW